MAVGVARLKAQGQVATNTDKVTQKARSASMKKYQTAKVKVAITSKRCTKKRAILSVFQVIVGF